MRRGAEARNGTGLDQEGKSSTARDGISQEKGGEGRVDPAGSIQEAKQRGSNERNLIGRGWRGHLRPETKRAAFADPRREGGVDEVD